MVERETRALSVGAASAGTCSVAQAEGSPITQIREVALSSSRIPPRLHLIIDCYSPCLYRVTATKLICSPRQHLFRRIAGLQDRKLSGHSNRFEG